MTTLALAPLRRLAVVAALLLTGGTALAQSANNLLTGSCAMSDG